MHTPKSNSFREGIEFPAEGKLKGRTAEALLSAMTPVITHGDRQAAAALIREAEIEHAGSAILAASVSRCRAVAGRGQWFETALEAVRRDLEEDRFADAIGHFREVMNLSRGLKILKAEADEAAQDEARKLLPQNWRVAEVILQEAMAAEPGLRVDSDLQKQLRRAREEETLTHAIFQADRARLVGKAEQARATLTQLLALHPGDNRIKERIYALDHLRPVVEVEEAAVATTTARSAPVAVVEGTPRAPESELEPEDAPNEIDESRENGWPTKVLIAHSAWSAIKNFSALAATTAMLAVAGILVWHHFAQPYSDGTRGNQSKATVPNLPASPIVQKPAGVEALKAVVTPDEEAWVLIKGSDDEGMIREFLASYPASPHALRAKVKLSSMDWAKVDKGNLGAIQGYLRQHPRSPYRAQAEILIADSQPKTPAEDREAILEAMRAYRSASSEAAAPTDFWAEPIIAGDQATIQCKRADGTPDQTFTLVRQDGTWKVQGVR